MKEKLISLIRKYRELISYIFFGAATTFVNFAVYTVSVSLIGIKSLTAANFISWTCAVIFAFFTNKLFVFRSSSLSARTLLREGSVFFASRALSGAIEVLLPEQLVWLGLDAALFGVEGSFAKLAVSVGVIILNYVFSKLFVFKKKK